MAATTLSRIKPLGLDIVPEEAPKEQACINCHWYGKERGLCYYKMAAGENHYYRTPFSWCPYWQEERNRQIVNAVEAEIPWYKSFLFIRLAWIALLLFIELVLLYQYV